MPNHLESLQEPCLKCLKKYGADITNWTPCKNCPWVTKRKPENPLIQQKKTNDKICLECQETLNFLEPEKGKYLCGKVKCLRSYIERHSEEE